MVFLIFAGWVALIAGVMFIFFPRQLERLSSWTNRVITNIDETTLRLRLGVGIALLLIAACLWYIAYYVRALPA